MTTELRSPGSALNIAFAVILAMSAGRDASAHRADEYLQAARISVAPDVIDVYLDLTPGIAVADSIIWMIDGDRDGRVSSGEESAYAGAVGNDLTIELDGDLLPLQLLSSDFPELPTFRRGEGAVRLHLRASPGFPVPGPHELSFGNTHHAVDSVYLANALVPESSRVQVTRQRRTGDQSELTIDYSLRVRPAGAALAPTAVSLALTVLTVFFTRRRRRS